jgi:hypothetical protein
VLDSILVGYYEVRDLMYAGSVRAGIPPEFRRVLLPRFEELRIARCLFVNLPDRSEGRWGEGLKAAKMAMCRWLDPLSPLSSFWNGRRIIDCVIHALLEFAAIRMLRGDSRMSRCLHSRISDDATHLRIGAKNRRTKRC